MRIPRRATLGAAACVLAGAAVFVPVSTAVAPTASFSVSPSRPLEGDRVTFKSTSSAAPGTTIDHEAFDLDGNGSFESLGRLADRVFATAGTFTVGLQVTNNLGEVSTTTRTVTVVANQPPKASFKVSPNIPTVGSTASFDSTSSDPDGRIVSEGWDLDGDGDFNDDRGTSASRVFSRGGVFTVGLRVTDDRGAIATTTQKVTVNALPEATYTYAPSKPIAGDTVRFTSTSSDSDGSITAQAWDFDDNGTFTDAIGPTAEHRYPSAGTFAVALRVTDNRGASVVTKGSVTVVTNKAPVAAVEFAPSGPKAGDAVTFTSKARDADGKITAEQWDLNGDGTFDDATGSTARRSFPNAGTYTVSLRAVDDRDASDIAFVVVAVGQTAGSFAPPSSSSPAASPLAAGAPRGFLNPFPVVTLRGRLVRGGARIEGLVIDQVPRGARVEVRCTGKGCPFKRRVRRAGKSRRVRFVELQRRLAAGVKLQVRVTLPGRIGKYTSFTIRRSGAPARKDRCMYPSSAEPRRCRR